MKKTTSLIMALIATAGIAGAADTMFFGSGTYGADVVITKGSGTISAQDVLISIETNATATIHRGKASAGASVASTGTNIVVATVGTNTIDGVTVTTSDYVIIGDQLRDIHALGPASASSTTVTVTSAATVELGEPVYVADAGDAVSVAVRTTWGNTPIPFLFKGFRDAPAAIDVPAAAGATMVSGRAARK